MASKTSVKSGWNACGQGKLWAKPSGSWLWLKMHEGWQLPEVSSPSSTMLSKLSPNVFWDKFVAKVAWQQSWVSVIMTGDTRPPLLHVAVASTTGLSSSSTMVGQFSCQIALSIVCEAVLIWNRWKWCEMKALHNLISWETLLMLGDAYTAYYPSPNPVIH